MKKNILKKVLFIFLTLLVLSGGSFLLINHFFGVEDIPLTDLSNKINQGEVEKIEIAGASVMATLKNGKKIKSNKEPEGTFSETIINYGADKEKLANVDVVQKNGINYNIWFLLGTLIVLLLFFGAFFWKYGKQIYFWKPQVKLFRKIKEKNNDRDKENFLKLLDKEEGKNLEFKSSLRWDYYQNKVNKNLEKVIAKTVVAFLNTEGGVLLIGVSDNGELTGLEKDYYSLNSNNGRDKFLKKLSEIINKYLGSDNHALITPKFLRKEQKDVCVLKVDKSNRPVYLRDGQENKFYIRTQNSSMELTGVEADQYKEKRFMARS